MRILSPVVAAIFVVGGAHAQSRTLVYDEFDDGLLRSEYWVAGGQGSVVEANGLVVLENDGQLTSVDQFDPDQRELTIRGRFEVLSQAGGKSPLVTIAWRGELGDSNGSAPGGLADAVLVFDYPGGGSGRDFMLRATILNRGHVIATSDCRVDIGRYVDFEIVDDQGAIRVDVNPEYYMERSLSGQLVSRGSQTHHVKVSCQAAPDATELGLHWIQIGREQFRAADAVSFTETSRLRVEDLDLDGDDDMVWSSSVQGSLGWNENLGSGNFATDQVLRGTLVATQLVIDDLNGDALPDLATANTTDVVWFENLGSLSFSAQYQVATGFARIQDLEAGDLDGDGSPDLVVGSSTDSRIAWFKKQGNGVWVESEVTNGLSYLWDFKLGDLDQDQDLDLVGSFGEGIYWFENLGGGSFGPEQLISDVAEVSIGGAVFDIQLVDMDRDQSLDVLGSHLVWYRNDGGGAFDSGHRVSDEFLADPGAEVLAVDLDQDQDLDVLVVGRAFQVEELIWYRNQGSEKFGRRRVLALASKSSVDLASSDFDGDSHVDLATRVVSFVRTIEHLVWFENTNGLVDADTDDDGLLDADEASLYGTNPLNFDTDFDGLSDGVELGVANASIATDLSVFLADRDPGTLSNPLLADTDRGGVIDGTEDQNRDGAVDSWETDPSDPGDESLAFYVSHSAPGQTLELEAYNASPFEVLVPAFSTAGPGPTPLGIGVVVDLTPPIRVQSPVLANGQGQAQWTGPVIPESVAFGTPVWIQLVEIPVMSGSERVSNPILLPVGAN